MRRIYAAVCGLFVVVAGIGPVEAQGLRRLEYAPAPVDNPLKGLVPYQADVRDRFPHSLEFSYLPYAALVRGADDFDWTELEKLLDDVASRGHQAVFRVVLEYPGRKGLIPEFLLRDGLRVHRYLNTNTQPAPPTEVETPDYQDPRLRKSLQTFIAACGKKYDGDPRIGFITAGLLGTWGEWHTYPREELFADKRVQQEVLDAYEAAFKATPVLLRYPAGERDDRQVANAKRSFGYHDDSFAWATLDSGKRGDEWFYMSLLKAAGPGAVEKWKLRPIGGEIRPEAWGRVFDDPPGDPQIQNFRRCVEATHVTWLMDSGMFERRQPADRRRRAEDEVRRMGYEFHAKSVEIGDVEAGRLAVKLQVENRGVAPFYYDWKVEWGMLTAGGSAAEFPASGKLVGLLPGDPPRTWSDSLDASGMKPGKYVLAVRVVNPLKTGKPLRFANRTQDADAPGWLSLGEIRLP